MSFCRVIAYVVLVGLSTTFLATAHFFVDDWLGSGSSNPWRNFLPGFIGAVLVGLTPLMVMTTIAAIPIWAIIRWAVRARWMPYRLGASVLCLFSSSIGFLVLHWFTQNADRPEDEVTGMPITPDFFSNSLASDFTLIPLLLASVTLCWLIFLRDAWELEIEAMKQ